MIGTTKLGMSPVGSPVVTIDDLKRHPLVKINYNLDDDILQNYVDAALDYVELYTGRAIEQNIYRLTFTRQAYSSNNTIWYADPNWGDYYSAWTLQRHFPRWLPLPPTQSILSFTIDDVPFTDYTIDTTLEPALLTYTAQPVGDVIEIEVVAGYATIPPLLIHAVRQYAAETYLGKDAITMGLRSILNHHRVWY